MMTLLRSIMRVTDNVMSTKRCMVFSKNNWNIENYFGSKVMIPSPPKRPLSAYMIFCKENRKELLKNRPYLSSPEQIKILAKEWNDLTEDMKKPYELSARQSTQLYGVEHKRFYENLTEGQKEELAQLKAKRLESRRIFRNKKALRDSGLPKAPNSAYALFVQSEAKKQSSIKHAPEFIKRVAELWNALPEDSKKIYEKQVEEEKKLYAEKMKEWHTRMLLEGNKKSLKAYEELKGKGKSFDFDEDATSKKKVSVTEKESSKAKSETPKN